MSKPRVLIIEDDPDGCRSVKEAIEDSGFDPITASTGKKGVDLFAAESFDAVLSDLVLPDIDGLEVLSRIKKIDPETPVIIMTAYGSVQSSVQAMKSGAYDYITKPLDLDDLQIKVTRAVETRKLRNRVSNLSTALHRQYTAKAMVADSPAMQEILRQIESLASTTATVHISGESGTGKELIARALHVDGKRSADPFVAVNCGAFAETLLESELFGHEKGAFTGAIAMRKGAFERADGGTLFLDEIGDAPPSVQVKLLRVLEQREITRVGGSTTFAVDVRLISASNRQLEDLVEAGDFRTDLLYRLNVVTITLPPLRDRKEDIRPLADRFIALACDEHGRHIKTIEPSFYEALTARNWPGNVRQLKNVIESAVVMARNPILNATSIPSTGDRSPSTQNPAMPDNMTLESMEREILSQSLQKFQGNRTLTAEKLGLSRRTIQRKIKEHNLPF